MSHFLLHKAAFVGDQQLVRQLLDSGEYDVNCRNQEDETPLHLAFYRGHLDTVRLLLSEYGADINARNRENDTPLWKAVFGGQTQAVEALISELGSSAGVERFEGKTLLHLACYRGHLELARKLIRDYNMSVTATDKDGDLPIHVAALGGQTQTVEALISEFGCSIDVKGFEGRTLLHYACCGGNLELVRKLIRDYNMSVTVTDKKDNLPIHVAALGGQTQTVEALISVFGCSVDLKGFEGRTILHCACEKGHLELVRKLIRDYNMSVTATDKDGDLPIHVAARGGQMQTVELLIREFGCRVDVKGFVGRTLLHCACGGGHLELVRKLIRDYNMSVTAADKDGDLPIHVAALGGQMQTVEALIREFGCSVDVKGFEGRTLLHSACDGGDLELVRKLIRDYNMSVTATEMYGNPPIHVAALCGQTQTVEALISEFGCSVYMKGFERRTLLHCACDRGALELVRKLIRDYNMSVTATDLHGNLPIHVAALYGQTQTVEALISEFGCYAYMRGFEGRTPLHCACEKGHLELVRKLLRDYYPSVMAPDEHGILPIHVAALYGQTQTVEALINEFDCSVEVKGFEGRTLLHFACIGGHLELVRKLIRDYNMSVTVVSTTGSTLLHFSSSIDLVKCLLYEHNVPVLARNKYGQTASDVAANEGIKIVLKSYTKERAAQLSNIKVSKGSTTRVFVVGHPGAGKSSLVEALKKEGLFSSLFSGRLSEDDVPPHTAGIVLSSVQQSFGRILFFDFAGDPEYYSSHAAILETLSGPGSNLVFVVVDLSKDREELIGQLNFWLTFVSCTTKHPKCSSDIFITGSHVDILGLQKVKSTPILESLKDVAHHICTTKLDGRIQIRGSFEVDCCSCNSTRMLNLRKHLIELASLKPPQELSFSACTLLGLLDRDFQHVVACKLGTLMEHVESSAVTLPRDQHGLYAVVQELHEAGVLLMIQSSDSKPENHWLILNISMLTQEAHRMLFSTETPNKIFTSVGAQCRGLLELGILPEAELERLLPAYIPRECLVRLQYCQEIPTVQVLPDHSILETDQDQTGTSLLFFPALIQLKREEVAFSRSTDLTCCRGCHIKCVNEYESFSQRFVHILLLRLAFAFALPKHSPHANSHGGTPSATVTGIAEEENSPVSANIQGRYCHLWKYGIHWHMEEGVECFVEAVNNSTGVIVITKSGEEFEAECTNVLSAVIEKVMDTKNEFSHNVSPKVFIFNQLELRSSSLLEADTCHLYAIDDIRRVLEKGSNAVISTDGAEHLPVSELTWLWSCFIWSKLLGTCAAFVCSLHCCPMNLHVPGVLVEQGAMYSTCLRFYVHSCLYCFHHLLFSPISRHTVAKTTEG